MPIVMNNILFSKKQRDIKSLLSSKAAQRAGLSRRRGSKKTSKKTTDRDPQNSRHDARDRRWKRLHTISRAASALRAENTYTQYQGQAFSYFPLLNMQHGLQAQNRRKTAAVKTAAKPLECASLLAPGFAAASCRKGRSRGRGGMKTADFAALCSLFPLSTLPTGA
jgi:hypothetical protein